MKPSEVPSALKISLRSLQAFEKDYPGIWKMLDDSRVGWPSGRSNGPRSSDIADPTGQAALIPDVAAQHLERVRELAKWLYDVTGELEGIRRAWRPYAEPPRPCANMQCPDRNPAAERRSRCLPCARHRQVYGCERGTEPVAAAS